jgi:hypothetical protein
MTTPVIIDADFLKKQWIERIREFLPTALNPVCDKVWKDNEVEVCSICLELFEKDCIVKQLPCHHCLHRECFAKLLRHECPLCRKPFAKWEAFQITIQRCTNIVMEDQDMPDLINT